MAPLTTAQLAALNAKIDGDTALVAMKTPDGATGLVSRALNMEDRVLTVQREPVPSELVARRIPASAVQDWAIFRAALTPPMFDPNDVNQVSQLKASIKPTATAVLTAIDDFATRKASWAEKNMGRALTNFDIARAWGNAGVVIDESTIVGSASWNRDQGRIALGLAQTEMARVRRMLAGEAG